MTNRWGNNYSLESLDVLLPRPYLSQMPKCMLKKHHISLMDIWAKTDIMHSDIIVCLFQIVN
jgi:hypothetical protein